MRSAILEYREMRRERWVIVKLSEFDQQLGHTRIHHSLMVQHSGSWPEGENQPNLTEVDNTFTSPPPVSFPPVALPLVS